MKNQPSFEESLHQHRILFVDDLAINRQMLRKFCLNAGFEQFEEASDGREALAIITQWKPDLVYLDMQMPVMNGLELCQELKRSNLLGDMVIIMQTIDPKTDFKVQAFAAGITDIIEKTLDPDITMARTMAHLERRYLKRRIEMDYRRIQSELRDAVALQNILLPTDALLASIQESCGLDIAHYYHPASELAGDYLSVRMLDAYRTAIISVDISGHGLTAALYAFSIHTLLEDALLATQKPCEVLAHLNEKLHAFMSTGKFATIFLGIVDTARSELHYAAAAAPPPILISNTKARMLDTKGHPLGIQAGSTYETQVISIEKGDQLFLYSDALLETPNAEGARMQESELVERLMKNLNRDAAGIVKEVLVLFYNHYSRQPEDDLSILACKFP